MNMYDLYSVPSGSSAPVFMGEFVAGEVAKEREVKSPSFMGIIQKIFAAIKRLFLGDFEPKKMAAVTIEKVPFDLKRMEGLAIKAFEWMGSYQASEQIYSKGQTQVKAHENEQRCDNMRQNLAKILKSMAQIEGIEWYVAKDKHGRVLSIVAYSPAGHVMENIIVNPKRKSAKNAVPALISHLDSLHKTKNLEFDATEHSQNEFAMYGFTKLEKQEASDKGIVTMRRAKS